MEWLVHIYQCLNTIGLILFILACIASFRHARSQANSFPYQMLTGAFGCFALSSAFLLLFWLIDDYPMVFSSGDLSWLSGLFFLITLNIWRLHSFAPSERVRARGPWLWALIAPFCSFLFIAINIMIYPDIWITCLLYAIPQAILAYTSLWLLLLGGHQDERRRYHATVLCMLLICAAKDFFSTLGFDYGYGVYEVIANALLMFVAPSIYLAARKGWPTCA